MVGSRKISPKTIQCTDLGRKVHPVPEKSHLRFPFSPVLAHHRVLQTPKTTKKPVFDRSRKPSPPSWPPPFRTFQTGRAIAAA